VPRRLLPSPPHPLFLPPPRTMTANLKQQVEVYPLSNRKTNEFSPPNVLGHELIFVNFCNTALPDVAGCLQGASPPSETSSPSDDLVFFAVVPGKEKKRQKAKRDTLGLKTARKIRKTDPERPKKHVNKFIIYRSAVCRAFQGCQFDISPVIGKLWREESEEMRNHCDKISLMERGTLSLRWS
jgi:Mating-type protein MAT alpha 1 HMG-box